jgi:hypothetical protein
MPSQIHLEGNHVLLVWYVQEPIFEGLCAVTMRVLSTYFNSSLIFKLPSSTIKEELISG